ncbi:hypothetical protein FACS1894200_14330 [Spirochaetia bacterium]|nr:hypothetical protein FACS1894200_14330 [Spirochaetia bacterium]
MYALVPRFGIETLPKSKEVERLADIYMAKRIIPPEYPDDARQVALASIEGFDCVVSWNMGHIVKQKTMIGTGFINKREGYPQICLATPKEIMEYDTTAT